MMVFNIGVAFGNEEWLDLTKEAKELLKTGKYQEAYDVEKKAIRKSENIFLNGRNTKLAYALYQMGDICLELKKYEEAESYYSKTAIIYYSTFGDNKR